jgi:YfiH family protein
MRRDRTNIYRSKLLDQLGWLDHGFGTRDSEDWPNGLPLARLKQIHSNRVVEACEPGWLGEGDALITGKPGLWLSVRTADCYPVILADREHRAVAVVHAGWRGAAGEIVLRAFGAMRERFGSCPENTVAAIGPGIGGCCYEVGAEVAEQLEKWAPVSRRKVDLSRVLVAQLESVGVLRSGIEVAGRCTYCDDAEFHSYRRERDLAGRMVSAAGVIEAA